MTKNPSTFTQLSAPVLQNLKQKFLSFDGTPFCFVEISHRSRFYDNLNNLTVDLMKKYFNAEGYEVLLMPSGTAMSSIYLNFVDADTKITFHSRSQMSNRYYQQMRKYHTKTKKVQKSQQIQQPSPQKHIIHYNKIEQGLEITLKKAHQQKNQILIKNINYCFPWTQTQIPHQDILYFQTETGFSIPGFTVLLIKKQLVDTLQVRQNCPDMLDFVMMLKMKSVINTPFTLCTLVLYENIKYAVENKCNILADIRRVKNQYVRMMKQLGLRVVECGGEEKGEREGDNFVRASYSVREDEVIRYLGQYGWVNKQKQSICIFLQPQNSALTQFASELVQSDHIY